ncbi:MAG: DUF523 domain-containing protein [Campylobacterales bacterium]|nr:DUF523 domain-containing protein [Campylobacterales bacterium]
MMRKKAIISACLLGEFCRYDGEAEQVNEVIEAFCEYDIIPFCPEAPLFGTPRERISVVRINGENRLVTDKTQKDVTEKLENEINTFTEKNSYADAIILKSKSPSCGFGTTPILNEQKELITCGNGIAAQILSNLFPHAKIVDEKEVINLYNINKQKGATC